MTRSVEEIEEFFSKVLLPQLRKEAAKGRWENISPQNFLISQLGEDADQLITIGLEYGVTGVWDIYIGVCAVFNEAKGNSLAFEYCPAYWESIEPDIKRKLDDLNNHFISTLPAATQKHAKMNFDGSIYFIDIEISNIEEAFDIMCNQLDEILPLFAKFNFQLPIPLSGERKLKGKEACIKEILENKLGSLRVVTQEEIINKAFQNGSFIWTQCTY